MITYSFDPAGVNIRRVNGALADIGGTAEIIAPVAPGGASLLAITVPDDTPAAQVQAAVDAATGVTPAEQNAWEKQRKTTRAKDVLTNQAPSDIAHRAATRVLRRRLTRALNALNETREVVRKLRADVRQLAQLVPGAQPTAPSIADAEILTEQQALAEWLAQIDNEVT